VQLTFVAHYAAALQRAAKAHAPRTAAALAFQEVIGPSTVAALTTAAGLLTLAFSDLPMVADFGRIGAAGVLVSSASPFCCRGGGQGKPRRR
jgi:predicted RND superfamily exporter protein